MQQGLSATRTLWPPIKKGYQWVHQAARILEDGIRDKQDAASVRRRLAGLVGAIGRHRPRQGKLATAMGHFLKVTASYWPGLFHCYDVPQLPRTNNDLEHLFGSNRHHERRATGRKVASCSLVLRGPVRLIAATATRLGPFQPQDLAPSDVNAWRKLREELEDRGETRRQRCRFRRDPAAYLRELELKLLQPTLPP